MKSVKDDARIFQLHHVSRLFVNDLAHAGFHFESLPTKRYKFRMKTHSAVHVCQIDRLQNLAVALDLDQLSRLKIQLHSRRSISHGNTSHSTNVRCSSANALDLVINPSQWSPESQSRFREPVI